MRRGWLPRLQDFLFIVLLSGAVATGSRMLNTDSDLGRHLTLGSYIISSHSIPTQNILSFTKAGEARPPYEWLAQVLLAASYKALNLDGVVFLTSFVIAAAFSFVYLDCVNRTGAPLTSLMLAVWAAVASSLHWLARPHIFSFLFFAVWLAWLEKLRRGERVRMWFFPALMLLWSNTHGGYVFGFLALGAYLAGWLVGLARGSAQRLPGIQLLVVGLTSGIASILTPDLWHNWEAVLNNRSGYVLSRTVETMPLHPGTPGTWPFLAMLLLALLLLVARRFRAAPGHFFLLLGLAGASLAMVRNIPLFAIAAAPIFSDWAATALEAVAAWRRIESRIAELEAGFGRFIWSGAATLTLLAYLVFSGIARQGPVFQFRTDIFPVKAADWLIAHPQGGRMFNDFNWGGYLLYRLWPEHKVFIDSQSDFYGEAFVRQYAAILAGQTGWDTGLKQNGVDWLLIPASSPLARAADHDPDWRTAYQDPTAVVLVRR